MERMATCPRCGNPVRLTKDELIQKRGTCLICDETFDVGIADLRQGDAPYRAPPAAIVARRTALVLPGVREDVDRRRIELRTQHAGLGGLVSGLALLPILFLATMAARPGHFSSFALLLPFFVFFVFWGRWGHRLLGGRDALQVGDGRLTVTRGFFALGRIRSFPLADVRDVYVTERNDSMARHRGERFLRIIMADRTVVKVGGSLGLDGHTRMRVKGGLQDRIKEPQRALPRVTSGGE